VSSNSAERLITDHRGTRYGEVLAVFAEGDSFLAHVYGTQLLNDCPAELWDALDATTIAGELDALVVKLNGPRHWMLDGLGSKGEPLEPVLREFGGLLMRRIAVLDLGTNPTQVPYMVRHVDRKAVFFFDAGKEIHELVDPDGTAYVMQAYCVSVDPTLDEGNLSKLADKLDLPEGWSFRSRILDEELVVDTSDTIATVLQDELENTYTLPA
jgi:hypothetical protein